MMRKITIMGNKYRRGFSVGISRRGHGDRRLYCVKRRNTNYIYIYLFIYKTHVHMKIV
jgi:hypothetical protein